MVCLNFLVGAKPAGEIHLLVSRCLAVGFRRTS
jgi:hypothetical protein